MIHESYKAPTAIVQEYKRQLEYKLAGMERPKRGHLIFEFDFDTGDLRVITPEKEDVMVTVTPSKLKQLVEVGQPVEDTTKRITIRRRPGCLYFTRLNYASAFKYLGKLMPGITFTKNQ